MVWEGALGVFFVSVFCDVVLHLIIYLGEVQEAVDHLVCKGLEEIVS